MRNIFDQYSQSENRLTHALATVLHEDSELRLQFLKRFVKNNPPSAKRIGVSAQAFPKLPPLSEGSDKAKSVPDIWLYDDADWCAIIECKISEPLSLGQINRHVTMAKRLGFKRICKLAITSRACLPNDFAGTQLLTWSDIYVWLNNNSNKSIWACHAKKYFEILEGQMTEKGQLTDGTLTTFSGFPDWSTEGYTYLEAKRLIKLALSALRQDERLRNQLAMSPGLPGRAAITGSSSNVVWDFLQLAHAREGKNHTENVHLTLGIKPDCIEAFITIPNGLSRAARKNISRLELPAFIELLHRILEASKDLQSHEPGAVPVLRIVQRRYPSQRSEPFVDANLTADLRTIIHEGDVVKFQPQWIEAAFTAFVNRNSNLQLQLGFIFPLKYCSTMQGASALKNIADAWIACKPMVDVIYR